MDTPQPVRTGSNGYCRHCGAELQERPGLKEHYYCNPKCRSAGHRREKQRSLNEAIEKLQEARWLVLRFKDAGDVLDPETVTDLLDEAYEYLRAAGAEPA